MTTWEEFWSDNRALADRVKGSFTQRKHATVATIRKDGSPRIRGTEVDFNDDGHIYLAMSRDARKADDLRRDSRLALHCPTTDPPENNPEQWGGEGKIDANAGEVEPGRFRLELTSVVFTSIAPGGQELEILLWESAGGTRSFRRG